MKTKSGPSGVAVELVILLVALCGGAGFFGIREMKHGIDDAQAKRAVEQAKAEADAANEKTKAAVVERDHANALANEREKRLQERDAKEKEVGRTIQQASIQSGVAVAQLPASNEKAFLEGSLGDIDLASRAIAGPLVPAEVATWKDIAQRALRGEASALEQLKQQHDNVAALTRQLELARTAEREAKARADLASQHATDSQKKAATLQERATNAIHHAGEVQGDRDWWYEVALGFIVLDAAVAIIWLLAAGLKTAAIGFGDSKPAGYLHTAADTLHSLLAPMSVLGQTHANRDATKMVDSVGTFMADLRTQLPENVVKQVEVLIDSATSPSHQVRIRRAYEMKRAVAPQDTHDIRGQAQIGHLPEAAHA